MGQLKQYRVAIYCRVSTDEQSCDRQERDLVSYAQLSGFEVIAVYKETASGAKDARPERKKVMALAQAQKIAAIIVSELSRWGRSTPDILSTLEVNYELGKFHSFLNLDCNLI